VDREHVVTIDLGAQTPEHAAVGRPYRWCVERDVRREIERDRLRVDVGSELHAQDVHRAGGRGRVRVVRHELRQHDEHRAVITSIGRMLFPT
jgi:hypothetical protein